VAAAANAAGTAITSPSGIQTRPAIPATIAIGIAMATSGATRMFAGTLNSETVPKTGKSNGSVDTCAAAVAISALVGADHLSRAIMAGSAIASANDAATERRNPNDSICTGSRRTIAAAAIRIRVGKSGLLPNRKAKSATTATIAERTAGGWDPETRA